MKTSCFSKIIILLIIAIFFGTFIINRVLERIEKSTRVKKILQFNKKSVNSSENEMNTEPRVTVSLKLENILKDEPSDDRNIFFIDSSHVLKFPPMTIGARQLCSFESAARANPNMRIYIVFITVKHSLNIEMTKPLNALLSYENINIVKLKFSQFAKNTPAENFMSLGMLKKSKYPIEHTSDVFRLLLLWKYGGTYLDSDMIVRKSIAQLGRNFACVDGEQGVIANAFLNFDLKFGHQLIEKIIKDQTDHFNKTSWGGNGPFSLSRVAKDLCGFEAKNLKKKFDCKGFHIHPKRLCYPILPTFYEKIFQRNFTKGLTKRSKHAVTVHMWNALTKHIRTTKNEKNFYTSLAKTHCPKVIRATDSEF